jgi:hypothetical protein
MATVRPMKTEGIVPRELVEFSPEDWPGVDGVARWRQARRRWLHATGQDPDMIGPLGDYVTMMRHEREAYLIQTGTVRPPGSIR